jgi:hypothetical protein
MQKPVKGQITETDLKQVIAEAKRLAGKSSGIVYVYSYSKTESTPKYVTEKRIFKSTKHTGEKRGLRSSQKTGSSPASVSIIKAKPGGVTWRKNWAVRREGVRNPVNEDFKSRDAAVKYASELIRKGKGLRLAVLD